MLARVFVVFLALPAAAQLQAEKLPASAGVDVTFRSGEVELAATLLTPPNGKPAPAVVIVHGSGDSDRSNAWTRAWAEALVARGIAVLHPDKRGCGRSGGDWHTASFEVLADDAANAVAWLRRRPEVDGTWVGVIGFSQGVDIVPVAAARKAPCDFVLAVSGSVVRFGEQIIDEIALEAVESGTALSATQRAAVAAAHQLAFETAIGKSSWEQLQAEVKRLTASDPALAKCLRGLGAPRDHWLWTWVRAVGDFDPAPHWQKVEAPMLFVYGGHDTKVDGPKSIERLRHLFAGREVNWSVVEFANNAHALFRDDLLDLVARWIRDRAAH